MNILLRKESNRSRGAEEGSNSHTQYYDAKLKETSRMNISKKRVWSTDHSVHLVLGDLDGWVTMRATRMNDSILGFYLRKNLRKLNKIWWIRVGWLQNKKNSIELKGRYYISWYP